MKKILKLGLVSLVFFSFSIAYAHDTGRSHEHNTYDYILDDDDVVDSTASKDSNGSPSIKLDNPLKGSGVDSVPALIEKILEIVLTIGTPLVAIMIIYSGYLFVAARGVPGEIEKAKETLQYTLIGAAILLGAYVIAEAIVGTVCAIKGGSC